MAPPQQQRLKILSVGGNAVSAFLSWRLQATNACDVTLVWKTGFENASQYGISMKSQHFGNERFKPYAVIRSPEEASKSKIPFDYVLVCIKALPDIYDFAGIVESVITPQHTCILINTTNALGIEQFLEQRFPTNVVLSLVSTAELVQLGTSEFEHKGAATNLWVGPANKNPSIPASIQADMAEALVITLSQGHVDCQVSPNIRQQQYENVIGNIAFHPASVLFETPNHTELMEKVGVKPLISGVIDELLQLATAQGCTFPPDFKQKKMEEMLRTKDTMSIMYQDFMSKRPMEVETFLGSPLKIAQQLGISVPRIETLYAMLHHLNIVNRERPAAAAAPASPQAGGPPPRISSAMGQRGPMMNGMKGPMRGGRAPSMNGPPGMRRGPPSANGGPPMNGYPRQPNGNGYGPGGGSRRPSLEGNDLEEFSHLMMYDNIAENDYEGANGYGGGGMGNSDIALRERELALRQRELALREQELNMRRGGGGGGRRMPPSGPPGGYDEEDDDDDYFDPMAARGNGPSVDPDNIDMMSVTSRRTRKAPSASQLRKNPEMGGPTRSRGMFSRAKPNRASARMMADVPGLHDSIMNNPLMGYSSDRYGTVDRQAIAQESRANSLTAARLDELQQGGGGYGAYPAMKRTSQSPGNALSPGPRPGARPSPPNGYAPYANGGPVNGRPSPPGMRQPVPRHPPGHGNAVAPHQVEQHAGW